MQRIVVHVDPVNLRPVAPGPETISRILSDHEVDLLVETLEAAPLGLRRSEC